MIILEDVSQRFGAFSLKRINLKVEKGEYFIILGPTGAGKTLLLETIAGFHIPREGRVLIDGVDVTYTPPEKRGIGFVYQDYALFPHMVVEENISFGLRTRRVPEEEIEEKISGVMDSLAISHLKGRYPTTLSGGEQQRVALARALAISPQILLLDEPLSALDPRTRSTLRKELRRIHESEGITTVHVTHDQVEALTLGDRVAVIMGGEIVQVGRPDEVFEKPEGVEVAEFLGVENILSGVVRSNRDGVALVETEDFQITAVSPIEGGEVDLFIRPENIILSRNPLESSARNCIESEITEITSLGPTVLVHLDKGLKVTITRRSLEEMELGLGKRVYAYFKATSVHVVPRGKRGG
ncbi:MAG: tungstate ABC transporter ATP-binding protein WtpC [Candidatus Bathyarchaeia archaeon]